MEPTSFWERFKPVLSLYLKITAISMVVYWFILLLVFIGHLFHR